MERRNGQYINWNSDEMGEMSKIENPNTLTACHILIRVLDV